MMDIGVLQRAVRGEPVSREDAALILRSFADGEAGADVLASFLTALHIHGETVEALLGFVEVARERMIKAPLPASDAIDLCGTGGDGQGTANISTAASFVAASAGATVAKHGNHAVSGKTGSADVLCALGVPYKMSAAEASRAITKTGIAFLYAPDYHPLFARVGPVRKAIGFRTAFNMLGPLLNPAGVKRQLVGAASPEIASLMAQMLASLGTERAWVVHTPGPFDEASLTADCEVLDVYQGQVKAFRLAPRDFGAKPVPPSALAGGDAACNARQIEAVLHGEGGPLSDVVCANAACALVVAGFANDAREGFALARASVESGAALDKLEQLRLLGRETERVLA